MDTTRNEDPWDCSQHPLMCKNIENVQKDQRALSSALGDRTKNSTVIGLQVIFTTVMLAFFGYNVNATYNGQQKIDKFTDVQIEVRMDLRGLQGAVEDIQNDLSSVKTTLKNHSAWDRK
jgi:hypothetical protein